jgi:hypothetical protein
MNKNTSEANKKRSTYFMVNDFEGEREKKCRFQVKSETG